MNVPKIDVLDFSTLHKIMSSSLISETQKAQFITKNCSEIKQVIANAGITAPEFAQIMKNRPIIKFHPLKNSFTKRGDKIFLAKTLGIDPKEVDEYIKTVSEEINSLGDLSFLNKDKVDSIKTYVFRHGSKKQLVNFLEYELTKSSDILKTLYRTLEYNSGGVADYFIRPIHRLDNKTLVKIYNIIDKHIDNSKNSGLINDEEAAKYARWALVRIYQIQNNNKLKNAIKTKENLS